MSNWKNNKGMDVESVLKIAFPDVKNFEFGMVVQTNNSEFIDDWQIFKNEKEVANTYLDTMMDGISSENKNILSFYINYDNVFYDLQANNSDLLVIGKDLDLKNKWTFCDVKKYDKNNKEIDLLKIYDDNKNNKNEKER